MSLLLPIAVTSFFDASMENSHFPLIFYFVFGISFYSINYLITIKLKIVWLNHESFITGITGQDGYYLSKLLLDKGYEVHGTIRRSSTFNTSRIDELISEYKESKQLSLYYSDLLDSSSLNNLIVTIMPDEVYNSAAQSHVAVSFKNPLYTTQTSTVGPITLLEAIKNSDTNKCKILSSFIF